MKIIQFLVLFMVLAAAANILFYIWFTRKLFGKSRAEKIPEEGCFIFTVPEKNFTYSIPILEYEKSKEEPIVVPGTDKIYLYRGRVYENVEYAIEDMAKRAGEEAANRFREKIRQEQKMSLRREK